MIATKTIEDEKGINDQNGVLINDSPQGFYNGLVELYKNLEKYDSKSSRLTSEKHRWKNIVANNLLP